MNSLSRIETGLDASVCLHPASCVYVFVQTSEFLYSVAGIPLSGLQLVVMQEV